MSDAGDALGRVRRVTNSLLVATVGPLVAIAVVALWHVPVVYRDVLRYPFLVAALAAAAEVGIGAWAVRSSFGRGSLSVRPVDRTGGIVAASFVLAIIAIPLAMIVLLDGSKAAFVAGPAAAATGALIARKTVVRPASLALVALVVALWLIVDVQGLAASPRLYDFQVYLGAGVRANAGEPVYLDRVLTALPTSVDQDPFLYPPPLIVPFRLLATLPADVIGSGWQVLLVAAGAAGLRLLGLAWIWVLLLLLWPPQVLGVQSGNIANLAFLAFAAGYRHGWTLPLGAFLKIQTAIPALWLVRERRWRALAIGAGLGLGAVLLTMPFTGFQAWPDWLAGLFYRQQSQEAVPKLYGLSLAAYLPAVAFLAVAVVSTVLALIPTGRRGLAALGLASIIAAPSLWPHGFTIALPAALATGSGWVLWLALGLGTQPLGLWPLFVVGAVAVGRDWDRARIEGDPTHPLNGSGGPWTGRRPASQVDV